MRTFICTFVALATLISSNSWAEEIESIHQVEIDAAYTLIFQTYLGKAVCRQILGADPEALVRHLGVSSQAAAKLVRICPKGTKHKWLYATDPSDIRKLTLKKHKQRNYKILVSATSFPIESWTEPFSNTTVIVTQNLPLSRERWVQILAHEMAVYFDSKANPAHPDAEQIPELRGLQIQTPNRGAPSLNPLIAATNPLQSHALTFVRALQVESAIVNDLIRSGLFKAPNPLDPSQERWVSESCDHNCLRDLVLRVRETLLPLSLPLVAFAPHFRSAILSELQQMGLRDKSARVHEALKSLPESFLRSLENVDAVIAMKRIFYASEDQTRKSAEVARFLKDELWAIEEPALFESRLTNRNETLLEYLKRPLLSGYNVGLSSGPRVRIRPGVTE